MKILFTIQGEGRGHLTQALSLKQKLLKEGHEVVGVLVGKNPTRVIPAFFVDKIGVPIYSFESPCFLPTAKNKQVCLVRSILYNLLRQHKYLGGIRLIRRMIKETDAEVVVNFYELLTGLSYLLFPPKVPMISIAHQYLFLHPDFQFPENKKLELISLRFFTRLTTIGAARIMALSFRKMRELPNKKMVVVPPLIRQEVLEIDSVKGNYLHGYLLSCGYIDEVKTWHEENPEVSLHFFWDKKGVSKEYKIGENLSLHQLDDYLFLSYMAGSKGYATTAGFESVCEAMYLGKPVLMIPIHIEQLCNAHDAMLSGAGVVSDSFNMDSLLKLSENYQANLEFRYWVKQADWLLLREFRLDLLREGSSASLVHRLLMSWLLRLMKGVSV